jgi:hypothetical protein
MPAQGNLAPQMDPIPIPQFQPVQTKSPQDIGMQPPPSTSQAAYYGGKTGVIANYADKFLQGWMTGKKIGEDKARQKAADSIGAAKSAVDVVGQSYRTAVESGDQQKVADTKKALTAAWTNYVGMAEKYVAPPPDQKKSAGKKVKDAVVPHGPQLYQQTTLNILKQTDPTAMYGPSKEDQLRQKQQESQTAEAESRKKITDLDLDERKKVDEGIEAYKKAIASGDTKAADDAARNLEVLGRKVELPSKQKLEQQVTETALSAADKLKNPNMQFGQLTDLEQSALIANGLGPQIKNPMQAYLTQVGPGKRFKTDYEAAHAFMLDERTSRIMGQKPTPLEELRAGSRLILQHDLQDPEKAKKLGLKEPLKAGEEPPKWLIEQEAEKRYKKTAGDSEGDALLQARAINSIVNKSIAKMSPTEQQIAKQYFTVQDPQTQQLSLDPFPDLSKVPEDQKAQIVAVGKSLRANATRWAHEIYKDVDDETIQERLGPEPSYGEGMTPPPEAPKKKGMIDRVEDFFMPSKKTEGMTAPPGNTKVGSMSEPPGNYKPMARYKLTKGSRSAWEGQPIELSAEEAKKLAAGGYTLEEVQ